MSTPTLRDVITLVSERYGLPLGDVVALLKAPLHPKGLRDEFALGAMQGLLASEVNAPAEVFASRAYMVADAMLKAREA